MLYYYLLSGYGAVGSALCSGRRGRQFEPDYSDQTKPQENSLLAVLLYEKFGLILYN